MNFVLATFDIQ